MVVKVIKGGRLRGGGLRFRFAKAGSAFGSGGGEGSMGCDFGGIGRGGVGMWSSRRR